MVQVVGFNKRVPPSAASRGTLAELVAKQKLLAEQQAGFGQIQPIQSWTQGAAQMTGALMTGLQQGSARAEETAGRERLAQIRSEINPETGATPAQEAEIYRYDPDLADRFRSEAIEARRFAKERELKLLDRDEQRVYEDAREGRIDAREAAQEKARIDAERNYQQGVTKETRTYERGEEERIDTREVAQEGVINDRERLETEAAAKAQRDEAERIRLANIEGGALNVVTGDEALKIDPSLDPQRQYTVSADGTKITDITAPEAKETFSYRPMTPEERVAYKVPEGVGGKMKVSSTGSEEPITLGQGVNITSQDAARIAAARELTDQTPQILQEIEAGALTGPVDYVARTFGAGRAGEIQRAIEQGADIISRHLTGAGKNLVEVEEFTRRYLPQAWNTKGDIISKVKALDSALRAMESGMLTRDFDSFSAAKKAAGPGVPAGTPTPEPSTTAPAPAPEAPAAAPSEEDIQETMRANNMTREQVLKALAAQGGQR